MNQSPITNHQSPLLVIVGQTASGKSALALEIASNMDGEIICADSRTVYKGMDIGTAKPSHDERAQVAHHLLDVVQPDEHFTVAQFKQLAVTAINDITARGKLSILVGGSGLYVDAVIFDYQFPAVGSDRDALNPRHTNKNVVASKNPLRSNTLIIGLELSETELKSRIAARIEDMIEQGFVDEIKRITAIYGPDTRPLLAPGYSAFSKYIRGEFTLQEAKDTLARSDYLLARKQRTWFKRNPDINWFSNQSTALEFAKNWLIPSSSNGQAMNSNNTP